MRKLLLIVGTAIGILTMPGGRRHQRGETLVVRGQEGPGDEAVGRCQVGNAGKRELPGQAVLQGAERSLAAPASLRRVGRNMLDPELRQRAADLGHGAFVHLPAGFGREEIMAAAIGVEAARKAVGGEHFRKPAQA